MPLLGQIAYIARLGLAIGVAQLCRYFLNGRIEGHQQAETEKIMRLMRSCDHVTAVLLVMAVMHASHNGFHLTRTD